MTQQKLTCPKCKQKMEWNKAHLCKKNHTREIKGGINRSLPSDTYNKLLIKEGKMNKDIAKAYNFGLEQGKSEAEKKFFQMVDDIYDDLPEYKEEIELIISKIFDDIHTHLRKQSEKSAVGNSA